MAAYPSITSLRVPPGAGESPRSMISPSLVAAKRRIETTSRRALLQGLSIYRSGSEVIWNYTAYLRNGRNLSESAKRQVEETVRSCMDELEITDPQHIGAEHIEQVDQQEIRLQERVFIRDGQLRERVSRAIDNRLNIAQQRIEGSNARISCYQWACLRVGSDLGYILSQYERLHKLESLGYRPIPATERPRKNDLIVYLDSENQCPHMGYVVNDEGRVASKWGNQSPFEVIGEAGDVTSAYGDSYVVLRAQAVPDRVLKMFLLLFAVHLLIAIHQ